MKNDLPISPNKKFKYSITFESWDDESLEIGQTDVRGYIEQDETDTIGNILYEANTTYGIYMPFAFGRWESTYPDEDADYFEKGIRKFYFLEITNEDGTQISNDESDFITFLLTDGRYKLDKFRDFAVGGIVLGSIVLGVGALITYFYFKDKKPTENKAKKLTKEGDVKSSSGRAKSVTHNINGVDRKFPIKDAWRKEHKLENKQQNFEVPQGDREPVKYEMGGDASEHYHEVEYGEGGVARAKDVIINKIGFNESSADYLVSQSEKFAIWLADSILKKEMKKSYGGTYEDKDNTFGGDLFVKVDNDKIAKKGIIEWQKNQPNWIRSRYSNEIRQILDWLQHPVTEKQDLRNLSFDEALEKAREWHNELQVLGGDIDFTEPETNTIIKKYPKNSDGIEYYWVFIPSNYCELESSRMGHCGRTGYGNNLISLRSVKPFGKGHTINDSHITIAYGSDGIFYQVKGKKNNKPAEKYFPLIFDLIKTMLVNSENESSIKIPSKYGDSVPLNFQGFGSEYHNAEDYGLGDMTNEEIRELYDLNPTIFEDAENIFILFEKGIITADELKEIVEKEDGVFFSFKNQIKLYDLGIVSERPSTIIYVEKDCSEVENLLEVDDDFRSDIVENILCGDTYELVDGFSYYYDNPSDLVNNLNKENTEEVINEIVRLTDLDKSVVTENGIEYYLQGEDEEFDTDTFDNIIRALANAQNNADNNDYSTYLYDKLKSALEELGTVHSLNDEGVKMTIDLSNLMSDDEISDNMERYEFEDVSDLFSELLAENSVDLPSFNIDSRYSPYGSNEDFNDNFEIDNYSKGGTLRPKTINSNKNTKIKNMKPNLKKMEQGGDLGVSKEDYFIVVKNWVYFTFNYPMGFVKDVFDSEHLQGKFLSAYDKYGSMGVLPIFWANLDGNNRRILSLWVKNNYFNEIGSKSKLQSISDDDYVAIINHWNMFCLNFPYRFVSQVFLGNTSHYEQKWSRANERGGSAGAVNVFFSELDGGNQRLLTDFASDINKFAKGGSAGEKSIKKPIRKKRQPKVARIQFEEQTYEYADGGEINLDYAKIEWDSFTKNAKINDLIEAGYSKTVAEDLSSEAWESLEKQVQNDFKNNLISSEIESMKSMMESLYTYDGFDRNGYGFNKYLSKYIKILGKKLFDKTYNEYKKELEEGYYVDINVHTDSEGVTYNSLKKKFDKGGEAEDKPYQVYNYDTQSVEGYFENEIEAEEFAKKFKNATIYDIRQYAEGGRVTTRTGILEAFLTSNKQLTVGNLSTHFNENDNQMLLRNYGTLIATRKGNDVEITDVKYSQTTSRITNELNSLANQKGMNVSYVSKFEDGGGVNSNYGKYGDDNSNLVNFDIDNLDDFETMQYQNFSKSMSKAEALQVLINSIEGDYSQLSEELREIAEEQMPMDEYAKGGKAGEKSTKKPTRKKPQPRMVRQYFEDKPYSYAEGGEAGEIEKPYQVYNYDTQNVEGYFDNEIEAEEFASKFKNATIYDIREYAEGGSADLQYSDILSVLKNKIDDSIDEMPMDYENASNFTGEEVEHESRSGFIPYTDGGYQAVWFEYIGGLVGAGRNLPTKPLDDEMERQNNYNIELAKDWFVDEYPEIVEELGVENIDYHSLYEAGYGEQAEELSEQEMQYDGEDTIMMQVSAYYYSPENSKGVEGKHTIRLFGDVNLESPYHRAGNLDDTYEVEFTFDSIDELETEMAIGIAKILSWFNGDMYNESTTEMRVRRMEEGGEADNNWNGEYLTISANKNRMVIKLTNEGVQEVNEMREDEKSDADIMYELFEDITANSELIYHSDLGDSGFGLTSASGITDGYYYNDNGDFEESDETARLYYFNDYALRSEIDDLLNGELFLNGADNKYAKGGKAGEKSTKKPIRKKPQPRMVRQYFEDKPYSYAKGGGVNSNYGKYGDDNSNLVNFDIDNLDDFETTQYQNFSKSMSKAEALQVLINSIEGDYSQLSEELREIAEEQMPMDEYAKGGDVLPKYRVLFVDENGRELDEYFTTLTQAKFRFNQYKKDKIETNIEKVIKEKDGDVNYESTEYSYTPDEDEEGFAEGGEVQEWMEEALESLIEETGNENLDITMVSNSGNEFFAGNDIEEYRVFKSEDDAEQVAVEQVRDDMEESPENFNKDFIAGYIDGRDFFEQSLNEMNRSYADDIASESDRKYGNRLIAEMVDNGLIDEDDAESDNADELAEEHIENFVTLMTEGQLNEGGNGLDYFISNFGEEETMEMVISNNLIDIDEASRDAVQTDGIGHFLSSYDGETLYLSDGYVAYRNN